jgi:chitin synthase
MLGLHLVPTILYTIMHKKFQLFVEMTFGAVSFIYYTPTYLIILNIYALCRMDDISWGTKGIDSETKSLSKVK